MKIVHPLRAWHAFTSRALAVPGQPPRLHASRCVSARCKRPAAKGQTGPSAFRMRATSIPSAETLKEQRASFLSTAQQHMPRLSTCSTQNNERPTSLPMLILASVNNHENNGTIHCVGKAPASTRRTATRARTPSTPSKPCAALGALLSALALSGVLDEEKKALGDPTPQRQCCALDTRLTRA